LAARILAAEDGARGRSQTRLSSARLDETLAEADFAEGHLGREVALRAYRKYWKPYTFTDEQVRPLWEGLRDRGVRVGILSDTVWCGDCHRCLFEGDGVLDLIDAGVYLSELAWAKPYQEAFRAVTAVLGVTPSEAVYVGDRPVEDIHGSQVAGMCAIGVPHSQIPAVRQVSVDATPDGVAHKFLGVLDGWQLR